MNKRLQKKKRLGPYQELAFIVHLVARPDGRFDFEQFVRQFVEYLQGLDMTCRGGLKTPGALLVEVGRRRPDLDRHRQAVVEWLRNRPELASAKATELFDIHRPPARLMV